MSAQSDYERVYGAFASLLPGDRVRVVEEFTITEKDWDDVVLKYAGDPATLPDGATGWEYWPTEHVKSVTVMGTEDRPVVSEPVDAAWSEFYTNDRRTPNRFKSKSSFEAGWEAALRDKN
ncbi:hypothetical protein LUPINE_10 [Microbacterium phage Lupine]|nr:hypothetical protein LUPINE_10 [Microbacterium phage Lupine]